MPVGELGVEHRVMCDALDFDQHGVPDKTVENILRAARRSISCTIGGGGQHVIEFLAVS